MSGLCVCVCMWLCAQDGWVPLHYACAHGHAAVVRLLIEHGAEIDARGIVRITTAAVMGWLHGEMPTQRTACLCIDPLFVWCRTEEPPSSLLRRRGISPHASCCSSPARLFNRATRGTRSPPYCAFDGLAWMHVCGALIHTDYGDRACSMRSTTTGQRARTVMWSVSGHLLALGRSAPCFPRFGCSAVAVGGACLPGPVWIMNDGSQSPCDIRR